MLSNLSISDGRKSVPVTIKNSDKAGPLAIAGQVGDEAISFLLESVQMLVVNTCSGLAKTVTLTIDQVHTDIDIVLQDGRNYRSITKKMNTAKFYSQAIEIAKNGDFEPEIKEILLQELVNECSNILQNNLRKI